MDLTKLMQQAMAWQSKPPTAQDLLAARGGMAREQARPVALPGQARPITVPGQPFAGSGLSGTRSMAREVPQDDATQALRLAQHIQKRADDTAGSVNLGLGGWSSNHFVNAAKAAAMAPFGGGASVMYDKMQKARFDEKASGLDTENYGDEPQGMPEKPAAPAINPFIRLGSGSTTVRKGPEALKGMEDDLQGLGDQKVAGQRSIFEGKKELAEKKVDLYDKADREFEAVHRTAEKKIGELAAKHAELEAQYDTARKEAAAEKVNPDQWWSNRSGGQKTLMLLATALGGFNEGFTQGRLKNTALAIMNREIDRDISAQRDNIAKKRGERREMLGVMQNLQGRIKDERGVEMNTRLMLQQDLGRRMQSAAAQVQDPILRGQLAMASAAILEDTLVKKNQAYMSRQATTTKTSSWRTAPNPMLKAAAAGKLPPNQFLEQFAAARDGYQLFSKAASKLKEIGHYGYLSRYVPGTDSALIRDNYLVPLAVSLRKMRESGVMTEPDFQRYKRILDSPFANGKELQRRIGEIQTDAVQKMRGMVTTYGQFYNLRGLGQMVPAGPGQAAKPRYQVPTRGERFETEE